MRRKKLIWQLYPSYLLIVVLSLIASMILTIASIKSITMASTKEELLVRNRLVGERIESLGKFNSPEIESVVRKMGSLMETRITIIRENGSVIADSKHPAKEMNNHSDRPEIISALKKGKGSTTRYSFTLEKEMLYAASVLTFPDGNLYVVRTSQPLREIFFTLKSTYTKNILWILMIALAAGIISYLMSARINRPLEILKEGARRFAEGDFSFKLPPASSEEISSLSSVMNRMADDLKMKIETIKMDRNKMKSLLESMAEGIVAVDEDGAVIEINSSARKLLEIEEKGNLKSKSIRTLVRHMDIYDLLSESLITSDPVVRRIVIPDGEKRVLRVQGSRLLNTEGKTIGAILVLIDVTRLVKLEGLRREFVSNVSHELKTPITSIKGYIETLKDGAIEDRENALTFLSVIDRQASRLHAIIEDLLSLSRIEESEDTGTIEKMETDVNEIFSYSLLQIESQAQKKDVKIEISCPEEVKADLNASLMEQAIVNLLENAIKYNPPKTLIRLSAERKGDLLIFEVKDNGIGIPEEHHERLFERFYRIDKSRSRKMGGTGLGLAIVKHIAAAHGGEVSMTSAPGKGSSFVIRIPLSA